MSSLDPSHIASEFERAVEEIDYDKREDFSDEERYGTDPLDEEDER